MKHFLQKPVVQYGIYALLLLGALVWLVTPDLEIVQRSSDFAVHIMLAFLFIGLFFFVFDQRLLMMTSLGISFLICLFLKDSSNADLTLPANSSQPDIKIAHVNVSASEEDYQDLVDLVLKVDADVISFQEVTPDWNGVLSSTLAERYPYQHSMVRIDPYGMAIFSKKPIQKRDTLVYKEIPNLLTNILTGNNKTVSIISTYMLPPLSKSADLVTKEHLDVVSKIIRKTPYPVLSLGDFNMTYWTNDVRSFREESGLENSRRDISGIGFKVPYDHIFYTEELECIKFNEITDTGLNHVGIVGTYQFARKKPNKTRYSTDMGRFQ